MFLHLSVILFVGVGVYPIMLWAGGCIPTCTGWGVCIRACTGWGVFTTPGQTSPLGRHPPGRHLPWADTPRQTPLSQDGHCSRQYTSYWNAFLLIFVFTAHKQSLGQGNIFASMCHSFCPQEAREGMHGRGMCGREGMHGEGGVFDGGICCRGCAWQGVGACMVGGMCGRGVCMCNIIN